MNITEVFDAIVYFIVVLLSVFVIPVIKNKVGEQNMTSFLKWVDIAVAAAEQIYESVDGEKKKDFVLSYLIEKGYDVDEAELDMIVEAAVNRLHNDLYGDVFE
jgi:hypothetical protein